MATYHAFSYAKMNQSFKMENESNESVFEANMVKYKLFSPCNYEFINFGLSYKSTHKVGKTKTVENGVGNFNFTSKSFFKFDGRNCFEILEEKGYNFKIKAKLDIIHPEFALVDKSGTEVAVYKMNVTGEREEGVSAIGNKQKNTVITTESDDLESVFFGAFILGRVNFSLYLL